MTLSRLNIFPWHPTHTKVAGHRYWTWFYFNEDTKLSMEWGVDLEDIGEGDRLDQNTMHYSLKEIINILFRRYVPCIPTLSVILSWWVVRFYQRSFLHLMRLACDLHFSVYEMNYTYWFVCVYWNIFTFLDYNQLGQDKWSFWYYLRFSCHYFIEIVCIYVHLGAQFIILFIYCVFL